MYAPLFDEHHQFIRLSLDGRVPSVPVPSGDYESNILCADCEKFLNENYENYAKLFLYGPIDQLGLNRPVSECCRNQHGVEFLQIRNVDYHKFKLFLLSVLWRASISSRPLFKNVSLGPHEEIIRNKLLIKNGGQQNEYPCIICTYRNNKQLPTDFIGQPRKFRHNAGTGYSFLMDGMIYFFEVSRGIFDRSILEASINTKDELKVIFMPESNAVKVLNSFIGRQLF